MKSLAALTAAGVALALLVGALVLGSGPSTAGAAVGCTATVDSATAAAMPAVAGYFGEQLVNAAAIMNAAVAHGLDRRAQVLAVMTAMGETSLRVLDYGDTAGPDSRGLFQQRDSWGTLAERMDPTSSAGLFYARLVTVTGWQDMTPTAAAHAVQANVDPEHYTPFYDPAVQVVNALAGTSPACAGAPSGDTQQLAAVLVSDLDTGTLVALPAAAAQLRGMASGTAAPGCGIDTRVLQIITVALRTFRTVGISSINRYCTQTIAGAGTASRHWIDGGGHAVDFYALNSTATNGADANALALIRALDPLMPAGSLVGQQACRTLAGTTITTTRLGQFNDDCNHLHVDVDPTNSLLLGG